MVMQGLTEHTGVIQRLLRNNLSMFVPSLYASTTWQVIFLVHELYFNNKNENVLFFSITLMKRQKMLALKSFGMEHSMLMMQEAPQVSDIYCTVTLCHIQCRSLPWHR